MIGWRYASAEDVDRYYGERPATTLKAVVILLDGEPVGIAGLSRERDRMRAFSEFKPELEPHLKSMTVLRAVKAVQRMIHESPLPVIVQDSENPALMERLGFTEVQPGVHLCHS